MNCRLISLREKEKLVYEGIDKLLSQGGEVDFTGTTLSPYELSTILENDYKFENVNENSDSRYYWNYFQDSQGREVVLGYSAYTFKIILRTGTTKVDTKVVDN